MQKRPAGAAGGKSVLHDLAKKVKEEGKKFPKIYAACGTADFLFDSCKAFAEELKELGADVTWDEVEGYAHEWRFWNLEVERFLDWLPREDTYAKKGRGAICACILCTDHMKQRRLRGMIISDHVPESFVNSRYRRSSCG